MIRNLLVITGVGFGLALVGIGGSVALVKNDVQRHDWTWVVTDSDVGEDHFRLERGEAAPDITRNLAWTGGERLSVDLPGRVTYVQGETPGVRVTGPKNVVERVRLQDGRLTLEGDDGAERGYIRWSGSGIRAWSETDSLRVVVTAPAVNTFDVGDDGRLSIRGYDQRTMNLTLNGEGDVDARGETVTLDLKIYGDGDADLHRLQVVDATIQSSGDGETRVGPTGRVNVDVSGDGDVNLTRRPAQLEQATSGWGEVEQD
ncbi:GIN domain-containing protein [Brevundimonas sp.]|uniref:GIN domain-containing protein n=1 Tax=Brevundimonas sp. TaxID=1871086 RepID=UPI002737CD47|nr:DUF2807 domain-containing protein [Brevundimonas sp.]MDP3803769.1 DUF2807 domain-containing protein [Brevundimonas sp.]